APNANIARHLSAMAAAQPARVALKIPRGRTATGDIDYLSLTFAELDAEVSAWSARLTSAGVRRGDRTLVMVRQGLPLIASAFALFRLGAVPVIIDPGMGRKNFLACVASSRPRALVGIPLARLFSRLFRRAFASVQIRVPASSSLTARLGSADQPSAFSSQLSDPDSQLSTPGSQLVNSTAADPAAVLFTSGSTGAPKGVCYEHGMFDAQVRLIREAYAIEPGEIDLPLLPIFALFNPALGMTTIVPEIDPRRPADVDPAKIVQAIRQEKVTNSFGSPTLWKKIGAHCLAQNLALSSLRRVLCAGAPVPAALWQSSRTFLPHGQLHSPYGATEALPVATISAVEIAALAPPSGPTHFNVSRENGADGSDPRAVGVPAPGGACVGRPVAEIEIKIIAITDAPIATFADARELPSGEIGEIVVRGPVVTKLYDAQPRATAAAKIAGDDGEVWHRMGDCGRLDAGGRLWFCGRKAERVETAAGTLFTEPCEQVFRAHPRVARCALIGLGEPGRQRTAIVVEIKLADSAQCRALARELRLLALEREHTQTIRIFYFREKFPVDVRHNAKIHRLALARWATTAKGFESDPKR
ncbi:MAG TPA: AMP-binding protein, partial [Opitutus sp.]|nr:AMP-binding protein [Opitutus sp.]